ncbi:MAG TPA: hypothetical protein VMQ76_01170 [Terracidiphilus sp.]|nr:hypothetical protein [Terracidiphilus sp.]
MKTLDEWKADAACGASGEMVGEILEDWEAQLAIQVQVARDNWIKECEKVVIKVTCERDEARAEVQKLRAALERIGTGWKYPLEHLNKIVSDALAPTKL